uniref:[histone H3]-lysine(27) N-trimethyltransferase n=1 Tax=Panagrellus redivivus TaxID=6233 RepID=A0A7E4W3T6_PANRE
MVRHRKKQARLTQPKGKRRRQARSKSPTPSADGLNDAEFVPEYANENFYVADEDCVAQIPELYEVIAKKYWERVESEGYKYVCPEASPETYAIQPDPSEILITADKKSKTTAKYEDTDGKVHRVKAFALEDAPTSPPTRYFTHTNVNIVGKSEYSLSHMPYFDDAASDDELLVELKQIYVEGIHGTSQGCGKLMNDLLLFQLADGLLKQNGYEGNYWALVTIMSSIFQEFPNKASPRDMVAMYPDLAARFDPGRVAKRTPMYDKSGKFTREFSAQEVMGNMASLMCKRCGTIDCIFHPAEVVGKDVHVERENKPISTDTKPCGEFCYRNFEVDAPMEPTGSKRKADAGSSTQTMANEESGEPAPEWTDHEKTLINMFLAARLSSNCNLRRVYAASVYKTMKPKTCKQVHDYLKAKGAAIDSDITDPNLMRKTKRDFVPATNAHHRMFKAINKGTVNNGMPYRSCNHDNDCTKENGCPCRINGHVCSKFCGCPTTCQVRFPGCRCKPGNCHTNMCQCFFASWECDPDICLNCNCGVTDKSGNVPVCRNVNIQRSYQRKLYIAPSTVAGTGCFAQEPIKKGQFIGEYVGEMIRDDEADRRGKIYDKYKCSYLFALNTEFTIDSTRIGNNLRFINHSKNPNCQAKVMVVGADHHIGVFALENIAAKQELFIDYAYNKVHTEKFVNKEQPNMTFDIKEEVD